MRPTPQDRKRRIWVRELHDSGSAMNAGAGIGSVTAIGNYRIVGLLGEGAMGVVYLGEHTLMGRRAAIKVLLPEVSHDEEVVARFFNEAKAATVIPHDGIVKIYDLGYHNDGRAYIVMEYLDGETLGDRLRREGRIPVEQACAIVRQIADALAAAHAEGVVHRDLKPDNIFIAADPEAPNGHCVKILDFGIAKLASRRVDAGFHTRIGRLLGTPPYMAPEQWYGAERVDRKTDIYALGCIFFEMVCGRPPFVEEEVSSLMRAHTQTPPVAASSLEDSVSADLDRLIDRLLTKDPNARIPSMGKVIRALDPLIESGRVARLRRVKIHDLPVRGVPVRVTFRTPSAPPQPRPVEAPVSVSSRPTRAQTTLGGATGAMARVSRPAPAGRPWSRYATSAAAALLLVAAGVLAGVVGGSGGASSDSQPRAYAAAAPERAPRLPLAKAEIQPTVTPILTPEGVASALDIASEPAGVVVQRAADGTELGTTPYRYELDSEGSGEVLILKKAGYRTATLVLGGE